MLNKQGVTRELHVSEMPSHGGVADSTLRRDVWVKGSYDDIRARRGDMSVSSHTQPKTYKTIPTCQSLALLSPSWTRTEEYLRLLPRTPLRIPSRSQLSAWLQSRLSLPLPLPANPVSKRALAAAYTKRLTPVGLIVIALWTL
jgi:hypothetical protein